MALCSVGPILAVMLLGIVYHAAEAYFTPVVVPDVNTTQDAAMQFALSLIHIFATFGQVDCTVSCAGGSSARVLQEKGSSFKEWSVSTLDWGIDVNLRAPMYLAHAVIGHMMERKTGVIIHIGSIDGQTGSSSVDYSAAKSGVMFGLTKSLARYGAPYGVRVNCVSPGPVLTRPAMANMPTLLAVSYTHLVSTPRISVLRNARRK